MQTQPPRSYRCHYYPRPDEIAEHGALPFVQVKAANALEALHLAFATVHKPIASVERQEAAE